MLENEKRASDWTQATWSGTKNNNDGHDGVNFFAFFARVIPGKEKLKQEPGE